MGILCFFLNVHGLNSIFIYIIYIIFVHIETHSMSTNESQHNVDLSADSSGQRRGGKLRKHKSTLC